MGRKHDLDHGLHNEAVFYHLLKNRDYTDWIVTTAFYSALHFVDYKLFPRKFNEKGVQIILNDMDSYAVSKLNRYGGDKHVVRLKLVERELRPVYVEFAWLFTNCNTARYRNYIFPKPNETCDISIEYLKNIKDYITA